MVRLSAVLLVIVGSALGPVRAAETPYDAQLLRLAEILGALHHLRPICGAAETATWRDAMGAILDAESPDAERRARFVDRFNRTWRAYAETHRTCTESSRLAAERFLVEGERLTAEIVERHARAAAAPR